MLDKNFGKYYSNKILKGIKMIEQPANFIETKSGDIFQILGDENLSNGRGITPYKSILFCVIDAIFSIRAKFNPTIINVFERTANVLGLKSRFEYYSASDFLKMYGNEKPELLTIKLFCNKQRTSTSNGVLKSEVVMDALNMLNTIGSDTIDDFTILQI